MVNKNQQLIKIHDNIEKMIESKSSALPKDFNKTRFIQNAMTVLQDTKNIEQMNPTSVARTILKGAFLGLDFFNRECYAIPYGNSLQFQTDYKGEKKLAKKYSIRKIKEIYAKVVREGDIYEEKIIDGGPSINFIPKPFNKGEMVGAFAVCLFVDGTMIYESMSAEEIEKVRQNYSKQPNGKAWKISTEEMYKKTVIRRLTKGIELEFETIEQQKAWEDGSGFEFNEKEIEPVKMPEPIQDAEVIDYNPEQPQQEPELPQAQDNEPIITEKQRKRLFAISKEKGVSHEQVKEIIGQYGYEKTVEIKRQDYERIVEAVEHFND